MFKRRERNAYFCFVSCSSFVFLCLYSSIYRYRKGSAIQEEVVARFGPLAEENGDQNILTEDGEINRRVCVFFLCFLVVFLCFLVFSCVFLLKFF